MNIKFVFLLFALGTVIEYTNGLSCKVLGRFDCISFCQVQNCATGYCDSNDKCRCSRCTDGPAIGKREVPLQRGQSCDYFGLVGYISSCTAQGRYCGGYCQKPYNTCICRQC